MKKFISAILVFSILISFSINTSFAKIITNNNIRIICNGTEKKINYKPFNMDGYNLFSIRDLCSYLGVNSNNMSFNSKTCSVTVKYNDKTIVMKNNSKTAYVNSKPAKLTVPMYINNGRAFIHIKFFAETLGQKVLWDAQNNTVILVNLNTFNNYKKIITDCINKTIQVQKIKMALAGNFSLSVSGSDNMNMTENFSVNSLFDDTKNKYYTTENVTSNIDNEKQTYNIAEYRDNNYVYIHDKSTFPNYDWVKYDESKIQSSLFNLLTKKYLSLSEQDLLDLIIAKLTMKEVNGRYVFSQSFNLKELALSYKDLILSELPADEITPEMKKEIDDTIKGINPSSKVNLSFKINKSTNYLEELSLSGNLKAKDSSISSNIALACNINLQLSDHNGNFTISAPAGISYAYDITNDIINGNETIPGSDIISPLLPGFLSSKF